eukprot:214947-Heterocapsa_arctica.AAC.1
MAQPQGLASAPTACSLHRVPASACGRLIRHHIARRNSVSAKDTVRGCPPALPLEATGTS